MLKKLRQFPPNPEQPWRLIHYADEVVPGNPLSNENRRKVWVVYFSFLEFGAIILQQEHAWLTAFVQRSQELSNASAGISQAFATCRKLVFGKLGYNIKYGGMTFTYNGEVHRLWAGLSMVLQDGGARKYIFNTKGDAGTKFCLICRNRLTIESELCEEADELTCNLVFEEETDFATDEDIRGTAQHIIIKKVTP